MSPPLSYHMILHLINNVPLQTYMIEIANGNTSSRRHKIFTSGTEKDRNNLKRDGTFGPLMKWTGGKVCCYGVMNNILLCLEQLLSFKMLLPPSLPPSLSPSLPLSLSPSLPPSLPNLYVFLSLSFPLSRYVFISLSLLLLYLCLPPPPPPPTHTHTLSLSLSLSLPPILPPSPPAS